MHLEGNYTFAAPPEQIWSMLHDTAVLATIIPGCEKITQTAENAFQLDLLMKAGPIEGPMQATIELNNINAPESYEIRFNAKGEPGFIDGRGTIRLESDAYMTQILYAGDGQAGGSLAGIGPRLLDTTAKAYIRLTLEGLGQHIQQRQMVDIAPAAGLDQDEAEPPAFPDPQQLGLEKSRIPLWGIAGTAAALFLILAWLGSRLAGKKRA
jgi:carbon monoxide dehydrogenase subunit G